MKCLHFHYNWKRKQKCYQIRGCRFILTIKLSEMNGNFGKAFKLLTSKDDNARAATVKMHNQYLLHQYINRQLTNLIRKKFMAMKQ